MSEQFTLPGKRQISFLIWSPTKQYFLVAMTPERKTSCLSDSQLTAVPRISQQQYLGEGMQSRASFLAHGVFDLVGTFKMTRWSQGLESLFGEAEGKTWEPHNACGTRDPPKPCRSIQGPPGFHIKPWGPAALHHNPSCTSNLRCITLEGEKKTSADHQ